MTTENDTMTTEKHGDVPNTSDEGANVPCDPNDPAMKMTEREHDAQRKYVREPGDKVWISSGAINELLQKLEDQDRAIQSMRVAAFPAGPAAYGDPDITERLRKASDHASPDMHTAIILIFQETRDVLSAVSEALNERPASLSPAQRTEELLAGRGYSDMDLMHHVLQLRSQARHLAETLLRDRGMRNRSGDPYDMRNEVYASNAPQRG